MIRTWNTLALASLLAAPAAASAGAPASELDAKAILSRLEDLRKTVDALSKKVEALPPKFDGKRLVADIERLENNLAGRIDKVSSELKTEANAIKQEQLKQKLELQGLKSLETKLKNLSDEVATLFEDLRKLRKQGFSEVPVAPPTSDKAGLDDIRTRLGAIEKVLAGLQPSPGINNRTSAFAPPVANLGRLVLVNERDEPMLFFVNGAEHRVDPHRTIPLPELAPGNVSYSVWADSWGWIRSPHTTMLRANETLRLIAR